MILLRVSCPEESAYYSHDALGFIAAHTTTVQQSCDSPSYRFSVRQSQVLEGFHPDSPPLRRCYRTLIRGCLSGTVMCSDVADGLLS